MENINDILSIFSVLILVSTIALVASKRVLSYIRIFRTQAVLLAAIAAVYGIYHSIEKGHIDEIFIIVILTVIIKVYYIPKTLKRIYSNVDYQVEKDFFINIPTAVIICCGLVVLTWFLISGVPDINQGYSSNFLVQTLSMVLIGLFFMISRKKAIGQIIGFLVIENGMFLAAMLLTDGMPMIVEFGIFFDLLTAVIIMGIFVFRINETFEHIDINKLRNLKG